MDRLKQIRRPVRAQLTRMINDCKTLLQADPVEKSSLQVKLQVMQTLHDDLQEHDSNIVGAMIDEQLDDDAQDNEFQAMVQYKESFLQMKQDIEEILHPNESPPASEFGTASTSGENKKKNLKYPKVELQQFDGELNNWLGWWSNFQKYHEDEDIHDADKMHYLIQSMVPGSKAHEIVKSYTQTAANYPKVIQALQDRFGREDLLLQVYVRELLTLVISNVTTPNKIELSALYYELNSHLRSLSTLKLDNDLLAIILFPLVESSLSVETLKAWQRSHQSKIDGTKLQPPQSRLSLLMDFIKQEVEGEQVIEQAQVGFAKLSAAAEGKKKQKKTSVVPGMISDDIATAAGLLSTVQLGCGFCDKKHDTDRCAKALSMTLEERKQKIKEKRLCYRCLKVGHSANKCKAIVRCAICGDKHYAILCQKSANISRDAASENMEGIVDKTTIVANNSNYCSSDVLLYTFQAQIESPEGTVINIRMVGDPGSQRSYVKSDVVRQAKCVKTGDEWIQNILFGGKTSPASRSGKFSVPIRSLSGGDVKTLNLLEKETICGRLSRVPNGPWVSELRQKGIKLTDIGEGWDEIHVLLGNDYWGDLLTGKMYRLSCGLVAIETVFGWTVGGPLPNQHQTNLATIAISLMAATTDLNQLWSLEAIGINDPIEIQSSKEK